MTFSDSSLNGRLPTPRQVTRVWRDVRDAVRGVERDYTTGSLGRAVLLLAVPMVLEMAMQSVFEVVDVYFVGRLGPAALAILGLADSLLGLVFAMSIGLSMGAAAMVARRIGEGSPERASVAAVQAIVGGVVLSAALGFVGIAYRASVAPSRPSSLRLLCRVAYLGVDVCLQHPLFVVRRRKSRRRVKRSPHPQQIMLGGSATVVLLFLINGILRGAGDPALAITVADRVGRLSGDGPVVRLRPCGAWGSPISSTDRA